MPHIFRARKRESRRRVEGPRRASPRERGYDAKWDRRSAAYRRAHPFCENVTAHGDLVVFGEFVDHKFPVQDGGEVHCPDEGIWNLCRACHAWKTALEDYARRTGQMGEIVRWCDEPEARPVFRRGDVR